MNHYLHAFVKDLSRVLYQHPGVLLESRMKSMQRIMSKSRPVRDALGVRVIYHPPDGGVRAYKIARSIRRAFDGTQLTRDYVRWPKAITGYSSLHLHVPYMGTEVEVQIRDSAMHAAALGDGYHMRTSSRNGSTLWMDSKLDL